MESKNTHIPLHSGYRIDKYEITNAISNSNVSITYEAIDGDSNKYIVKEYYPIGLIKREDTGSLSLLDFQNQDFLLQEKQNLINIATTISSINHPNIINIINIFDINNTVYLVSEYVGEVTLNDIFQQTSTIDFDDIKRIVFPILEGLKVLHKENINHLAISPKNILIQSDGAPILTGFGSFYKIFNSKVGLRDAQNHEYAPPEQYTKQQNLIGPWSDIFALGAVLYQCISGSPPPQSLERYEAFKKYGEDPIVNALEKGKGKYSVRTLNAINHALNLKPADRPKTVSEWSQDFLALTLIDDDKPNEEIDLNQTLEIQKSSIDENIDPLGLDSASEYEQNNKLLRAFLGGNKQSYYMSSFLTQKVSGWIPRMSWNFSAFIFTYFWMLYRKMYLSTLIIFICNISVTLFIVYPFLLENITYDYKLFVNSAVDTSLVIFLILSSFLIGNYGNYLYFLNANRIINKFTMNISSISIARKELSNRSNISYIPTILLLIATALIVNYGYLHLKIKDGLIRLQIDEGMQAISTARTITTNFRMNNGMWPSNDEFHRLMNTKRYKYISDIVVIQQLIVLNYQYGQHISPNLEGKAFGVFGHINQNDNSIKWICGSVDIPLEYMPVNCKSFLSQN